MFLKLKRLKTWMYHYLKERYGPMKVLFTKKSNRKILKMYTSSILCLPEIFKIAFLLLIQIHGTTNTTLKKTITFYFGSLFLVIKELTIKFFTITWLSSGQEIYHHLVAIWRFFWHPFALYYNDSKKNSSSHVNLILI